MDRGSFSLPRPEDALGRPDKPYFGPRNDLSSRGASIRTVQPFPLPDKRAPDPDTRQFRPTPHVDDPAREIENGGSHDRRDDVL